MNFDKEIPYLGCFALYSIVLLIVRRSRTQQQNTLWHFYLGNRQLNLFRSTLTFIGTWIPAATVLGFTENVFRSGLAPLLYSVVPWFFGAFLLQMISGHLYGYDMLTIPELIGEKYGSKWFQVLFALVMMVTYTLYIIIHTEGFGLMASDLFNIPYNAVTLMTYLLILYPTFGGYRVVTRIDVAHILLLTVGTASIYLLVAGQAEGFSKLFQKAGGVPGYAHDGSALVDQPGDLFRLFDGEKFTPRMSITMFFGQGLSLASDPQYMIHILSAKDKRTARSTVRSALCYLAVFYFTLLMIGLEIRVLFPSLAAVTNADDMVMYVLSDRLFTSLNTLFLFAILGAYVPVTNSQLLLFSISFAYDMIRPLCPRSSREYMTIPLTCFGVLIGGTLSLLFSTHPPASLLFYGGDIWGIFGAIFFPALYGALLCPEATRQGARAALLVGFLAIVVFYPLHYSQILSVHPMFPGTISPSLGFFPTSRLTWKEGAADALQADL